MKPFVSICCITYNHEQYINKAIEGFLMQKTTFPIEIIIHDDASSDATAQIILGYKEKYPEILTAILQQENQYKKGGGGIFTRLVFPKAKGKYIAICEGDDYWTDPYKLQKQVDFLEANSEFVISAHEPDIVFENVPIKEDFYKKPSTGNFEFTFKEEFLNHFIATACVVFKRESLDRVPSCLKECISGDILLFLYLLTKGKGYYFEERMAVKRRNPSGITMNQERQERWYVGMYKLYQCVQTFAPRDSRQIVLNRLTGYERGLAKRYRSSNKMLALFYLVKSFVNNPQWYIKKLSKVELYK